MQLQKAVCLHAARKHPQRRRRKRIFAEAVIAAHRLIERVHGIKRLFAPRAVFIVLMHAKPQRMYRRAIDLHMQPVAAIKFAALRYRIVKRAHARVKALRRSAVQRMQMHLQTSHADALKIVAEAVRSRAEGHGSLEHAASDVTAYTQIVCAPLATAHAPSPRMTAKITYARPAV